LILLLKASLVLVLTLLVFTRYSHKIKIYSSIIFIFLIMLIYKNHFLPFETTLISLLGVLFILIISKFYSILILKRKRFKSSLSFLVSTIICAASSFIFLEGGITDPIKFSLLFAGIYLLSNPYINLDLILGTLILSSGIVILKPMPTIIIISFLCLAGFISIFIFNPESNDI
jgi:hypothetical protein